MRNLQRTAYRVCAIAMLSSAMGACGSYDIGRVNLVPSVGSLSRPDWLTYSGGKNEFALRPVANEDLVNADGQCPVAAAQTNAPSSDSNPNVAPSEPLVSGGIALQMTECDVVRRAGHPEQLQIGTNARGERTVVITYTSGPRPGIYRFAGGRLNTIERAPGGPAERPKPKSKAKKAARS